MDWPSAATIMTVVLGAAGAAIAWLMNRGHGMEQEQKNEQCFEEKLGEFQASIQKLEVDVEVMKNNTGRTERDVHGLGQKLERVDRELARLNEMIVKYLLPKQ